MIGFAKKIGMTRLFMNGKSMPVTVIRFGDSQLVQTKIADKDGYDAVQMGAFPRKNSSKISKAIQGHTKKHTEKDVTFRILEEFRDVDPGEKKSFGIDDFSEGDEINVTGIIKGRGFTGVVKRYGFRGQPKSHGHDHERAVGSIGAAWPQRVNKGIKMAGRSGNNTKTLRSVNIVSIDVDKKLIFVKGSLPGSNGTYLKVKKIIK